MSENLKDTHRAFRAAKEIIDGRDPVAHQSAILVTAEHAIASLLLLCMGNPRKAAAMLNEGLVPGIEERLSLYASKGTRS
ncbi:hypothetical protein [Rhizobium sp. SYY.PMSO]|uniref:hypothetical protein n=1 Tax=Rhizobium sp. SYY.PMSO TaxID=3382192 RepID=UPI00398FFEAF